MNTQQFSVSVNKDDMQPTSKDVFSDNIQYYIHW